MAVDALVMDLDGTLWDSAPWYATAVAMDAKETRNLIKAFRDTRSGIKAAVIVRERLGKTRFARYCKESDPPVCFDGAISVLGALAESHISLAAFTSLPAWMAVPMLGAVGLAGRFNVIQTARRGIPAKPSPVGLRLTCQQLQSGHATYVGDTEVDQRAASAASLNFIWAAWGYETPQLDATIATSWRQLPELL